jgi:N-acetylmuramic acid 6-phosphate etherase
MKTNRDHLLTELRLPSSMHLDEMSVTDALEIFNAQDALAVAAVAAERAQIAKAIELVVAAFNSNGRLLYFGAGTSGRLGVLDASECPPTFRTDPLMVQGIIAGGIEAMFKAKEGAEDDATAGAAAVDERAVTSSDVVMGIAAGGTTAFVHGALRRAIELKARTIFLSCVQPVADEPPVDVVIRPLTGPEVLTGSTRLKAGTATKLVLNQITTLAMVQMGKCYENLMVDLRASNDKLKDRATRMVSMLTGLDSRSADEFLTASGGHVKVAVVMYHHRVDAGAAVAILKEHGNRLRPAIESGNGK